MGRSMHMVVVGTREMFEKKRLREMHRTTMVLCSVDIDNIDTACASSLKTDGNAEPWP